MPYHIHEKHKSHTDTNTVLMKPPCIKTQHHEYKRKQMEDVCDNDGHIYNIKKNETNIYDEWN